MLQSGINDVTVIYNPELVYSNSFITFIIKYIAPTINEYKYSRITYTLTRNPSIEIEHKSIINLKKGPVDITFDIPRCYIPPGSYTFTVNIVNNVGKDVTRVVNFTVQ